jgi:hypothetical protein
MRTRIIDLMEPDVHPLSEQDAGMTSSQLYMAAIGNGI